MTKKFYVSMAVELRTNVEIEANSLEEAKESAESYVELGDLNLADIIECYPVNISDENGNLLEDLV